jgi:hypothetical protein
MEPSDALRAFRYSFYDECLHRRADALFELTYAILTADAVPSPVHLSLQASHRRGWGSLYAALDRGRIDAEALRQLLARHPLAGSATPAVYAVDTSVWDRSDAECVVPSAASTTTPQGTRPGSPSSPDGPTSSSLRSASPARVGPPSWEERMIPGKLSGKNPSQRPFRTKSRTKAPVGVPRMSSPSRTRKRISVPLRVLGRSRSKVGSYARMRPENS